MKFELIFRHMPEYVLIRTEGEASVRDFDVLLTTLVNSPRWVTGTDQILDHRKIEIDNLHSDDVRLIGAIAKIHSEKLGNGRCAFLVNDVLGFGLIRMYELIGGGTIHTKVGIFHSINEAIAWLKE